MRVFKYITTLVLLTLAFTSNVKASHMAGGEITYTCVGQDSFLITLKVFRYCNGAGFNTTNITVNPTSTCGGTAAVQLTRLTGPLATNAWDISQICSSQQSNCASGSTTGYEEYIYQGIFVANPRCNCWTIGYSPPCCRNSLGNASASTVYFDAELCNTVDSCNNSPTFGTSAIPYVCAGFPVSYNMGATDPDGDSLSYKFICPRTNATTCITWTGSASTTNAFPGIILDTLTGQIRFTPTVTGSFVLAVEVTEWDANGNKKGTTMRDIQFRVETCSNTPPYDTLGITNYTGVGYVNYSNNIIEVCLGDTFSFDLTIWDYAGYREDTLDTLLITSNVSTILPGATFSINAINDSVHVVTIGWRAVQTGSPSNVFFVQTSDDACPVPGFTTSSYTVKTIPATEAGPPKYICKGVDTASVYVIGGTAVTWRTLYGAPIVYGSNFDCDTNANDTCMQARFYPNTTTVYEVSSNLGQGCKTKDTIKVVVAEDFTLTITDDTTICFNDSTIQIDVNASLAGGYKYRWRPDGSKLDFDTAKSPNVTPIFTTDYRVTVTSDSGCIKSTSMNILVTPPFPELIRARAQDTVVCAGNPVKLEAVLGHSPTSCGLSSYACSGSEVEVQIGFGTNANSTAGSTPAAWPSPYGGSVRSARHQFLIRRSELSAASVQNGMFTSLSFNVASLNQSTYAGYTIKLGCTSDTVLSAWKTGLSQVFTPKPVTVAAGWNTHLFDQNYDYDGVSNVVVEICFNNSGNALNSTTYYTNTGWNSCYTNYSTAGNVCNTTGASWASQTNRPNMKFGYCQGPDSAGYRYQWLPSTYLNNDTLYDPTATIYDSITYQVVVTDTFGKCSDTSLPVTIRLTTVDVGLNDTAVCPGVPVALNAAGSSLCPGGGNFAWDNGAFLNDDSIQNPIATVYNDTKFTVTFYDTCGCSTTDTVWIRMDSFDPPNVVGVNPNCGFDNGAYNITGSGGSSPYVYSIDSGLNYQASGTFTGLANGYYNIVIKDAGGCYSSGLDTLKNNAPLIDSILTRDLNCWKSDDGLIEVFASGGLTPYEYSSDSGNTFITSNQLGNLKAQDHFVIVKSSDGCFTTPQKITLTEPPLLESSLRVTEVSCYGACDARSIAKAKGGVPPYSYNWGNGNFGDTALNVCGGLDSLVVRDAHNCVFDSVFTVIEYPLVKFDSIVESDVTCFGYDDAVINIAASGGKSTLYFSINNGTSFSTFPKFSGLTAGNYQVLIRDINNCRATQSLVLTEPPRLELSTNIDSTVICVSSCTTLTATAKGGNVGPYNYYWGPGLGTAPSQSVCPGEDEIYTIYAEDTKGCVTPLKTVNVQLYDSLRAEVSDDVSICLGERTSLKATAFGGRGAGYRYNWTPISGLTSENSATPTALPFYSTMYYFTLSDDCGTPSVYDSVYVNIRPLPEVNFVADTDLVCNPGAVTFENLTDSSASCVWSFGNGVKLESCEKVSTKFVRPGNYNIKLRVTDFEGCTDSLMKEAYITVLPAPVASFNMTPNPVTVLDPLMKFNDASRGNVVSWDWSFESLGSSKEQNPSFSFPDDDTAKYPVRLLVQSENGCVDDTIMTAVVGVTYTFFVPSSFTPNGDGNNEVFKPVGMGIEDDQFLMQIYDRWGKLVFESKDQNTGWDGTVNGSPAQVGTYTWSMFIGDYEEVKESHEYMGSVALFR